MSDAAPASCPSCGTIFATRSPFCAACGARRAGGDGQLAFVLRFYAAVLVVLGAAYGLTRVTEDGFLGDLVGTLALAAITGVAALRRRSLLAGLYTRAGFSWRGYGLIVAAAPAVLAAIVLYVDGLGMWFGVKAPPILDTYQGRHLIWAFVLVAVTPPLIEELGFRGIFQMRISVTRSQNRSLKFVCG